MLMDYSLKRAAGSPTGYPQAACALPASGCVWRRNNRLHAMVTRHPHLKATVLEKRPVDRLASRSITERGFSGRVSVATGDMFHDPLPMGCDIHLFSNVLHDWDGPTVQELLAKSFASLVPGGMIVVHDAHINAAKTGPLPVAAYSALF